MFTAEEKNYAMSESRISQVTDMFTPIGGNITFTAGTRIFEENDKSEDAYLIQKGYVEISRGVGTEKEVEYILGPGEIFGEIAVMDGKLRTATAVAIHDTTVAPLTKQQILTAIEGEDPLTQLLLHTAIRRLRKVLTTPEDEENQHLETIGYGSYFQSTQKKAIDYVNQINLIRKAVEQKKFHVVYQPIVDISSGFACGFEALVRGPKDTPEIATPDQFIPMAEETGLIIPLGQWVLETAISALNSIEHEALKIKSKRTFFMSVNVSAKQLENPDIVEQIAQTIEKSGFQNKQIKLEITETALLKNPEVAQSALNRLKQAGASIAIDDFGTGYSSLNYLHQFPINTMKIDRSFITELQNDDSRRRIVKAIISMAHDLNMDVVAEGIETSKELERLSHKHCDYAQGFYFDKPRILAECIPLIKNAYY